MNIKPTVSVALHTFFIPQAGSEYLHGLLKCFEKNTEEKQEKATVEQIYFFIEQQGFESLLNRISTKFPDADESFKIRIFFVWQKVQLLAFSENREAAKIAYIQNIPATLQGFEELHQKLTDANEQHLLSKAKASCSRVMQEKLEIVEKNRLTHIPWKIVQWQQLNTLTLSAGNLTVIPAFISQLTALHSLCLRDNKLISISPEIGRLTKLSRLFLQNNLLHQLPLSIFQLPNLQRLDLRNNQLQTIPKEIGNLKKLHWLLLNGNRLETLPVELNQLSELAHFEVSGNPFRSLPSALLQTEIKPLVKELQKLDQSLFA